MVENVDWSFPKSKMTSTNVLFCPQPQDIQFTIVEEKRNHKIFTFKKLVTKNLDFFSLKKKGTQTIIKLAEDDFNS